MNIDNFTKLIFQKYVDVFCSIMVKYIY